MSAGLTLRNFYFRLYPGAIGKEQVIDFLKALALVRATGAEAHTPTIHLARAELAGVLGNEATRERELRHAQRLYTEMGATGHAERVGRELER